MTTASKQTETGWSTLDFAHPLEFLAWLDPEIHEGVIELYPWQKRCSQLIGLKGLFTKETPLELFIPAANGSGKDAYINSATALWFAISGIRRRCIITSSSYVQMQRQTVSHIVTRARQANKRCKAELGFDFDVFDIKKDYIFCDLSGSEIVTFVTDDPGKAEGYHPWPDCPTKELMIITNEAKSILENIFTALRRCTFTHWISVSTPGKTSGFFFKKCKSPRTIHYPKPYKKGHPYYIRVTSYDCKHIPSQKIEDDKEDWGENSLAFRSKHLALFTSTDEAVVITSDAVESLQTRLLTDPESARSIYKNLGLPRRAGLDIAAGGDETALYIFKNNKYVGREILKISSVPRQAAILAELFDKWFLVDENIFADEGGVGKGVLDCLADDHGIYVRRVLNNSRARNFKIYANKGAETWFNFKKFIEKQMVTLPVDDKKLWDQLANRYYKYQDSSGRFLLEDKAEAKSRGIHSPDRADAVALAFTDLYIRDFTHPKIVLPDHEPVSYNPEKHAKNSLGIGKTLLSDLKRKHYEEDEDSSKPRTFLTTNNILSGIYDGRFN